MPTAVTEKVTADPLHTVAATGCVEIDGPPFTTRAAPLLVAEPQPLVTTQS